MRNTSLEHNALSLLQQYGLSAARYSDQTVHEDDIVISDYRRLCRRFLDGACCLVTCTSAARRRVRQGAVDHQHSCIARFSGAAGTPVLQQRWRRGNGRAEYTCLNAL
ncbi:MAG: hypothetical protein ACR5LD_08200 [Symbiopectobacterium sp.]